jgi:hypothetical protein
VLVGKQMKQARQPGGSYGQVPRKAVTLPDVRVVLTGFLTLMALVVVAERAGLPAGVAQSGVVLMVCLLGFGLLWSGRTAEESAFTGRSPLMHPLLSGLVAGTALTGLGVALLRPVTAGHFMTILTGQSLGIIVAHGLARWRWRKAESPSARSPLVGVFQGVLQAVAGGLLGLLCLALLADDLATAVTAQGIMLSVLSACVLIVLLPLLAVACGGVQASLVVLVGLATLAAAGFVAILATGLLSLGTLPLPSFSESPTLAAISEAKARWFATPVHPVLLTQWPALASGFISAATGQLVGAACVSCFVMLSLFPAIPLQRRSILLPTLATSFVLPLCLVVAGGYAIEAAGFQFVGASVQRPPAGLLEAVRNGFVTVCNAAPLTVDALRAACGVSPRDVMLLDWQQVRINRSFLSGGLLSAMAYPVAMGVLARAAEPLLLLAGLIVAFWIAARGLGLGVLARDRAAPGLASLRLGFVRVAAVVLATVLVLGSTHMPLSAASMWQGAALTAGVAAGFFMVVTVILRWHGAEGSTPQPTPASGRSGKKMPGPAPASTQGETV